MHNFKYHILKGKSIYHPSEAQFRNIVFENWYRLWDEVYKSVDSSYVLSSDEFARQDIVAVITDDEKIAGIHLYSFYSLRSTVDINTKYFHFFSPQYVEALQTRGAQNLMSMEFLTVMPGYRKSQIGFSLGSTLIQLGCQVFGEVGADAIVAPARNDVGVNTMAYELGFDCIEEKTQQRGFECDLIACFQGKQRPSDNVKIRSLCLDLWENKTVYASAANSTMVPLVNVRKAA